ncbi:cysteine dioxygenase family protein [Paenibacillus sp. J2TS4]|uniref:cysteine dioxygenase n=1 Tax=Paenibacillus sp. J2TS4 TaxID=2807194 RepID=UPI001B1968EC|nr:cysteine dioxygenase family protein [Paenibacillus sp. J2TS4]GIP31605.1 cysteine dioxygenase [Paenibacillus sp. J2TS4]
MNWLEEVKRVTEGMTTINEVELGKALRRLNCTAKQVSSYVTEPRELPYGRRVIHRTEEVEAIVVHLPAGRSTFIHDHGESVGCGYVVQGTMINTIYTPNERGRAEYVSEAIVREGDCFYAEPGQVHAMRNPAKEPLITFHLYAPPLEKANRYETEWVLDYVI